MNKSYHPNSKAAGFSLIELLIVVVIIGIIAAIAVPNLLASRRSANGASAVQTLRNLFSAQETYKTGVGNSNYGNPQDLFNECIIDIGLARACNPTPTGTSKCNLTALSGSPKAGFIFNFTTIAADTVNNTPSSYTVLARPIVDNGIGRTGNQTFFVDETGVLRNTSTANVAATSTSPPINN